MSTKTTYKCDLCGDEVSLDDSQRQLVAFEMARRPSPSEGKPTQWRISQEHPSRCLRHACKQCITGMGVFHEMLRETRVFKD